MRTKSLYPYAGNLIPVDIYGYSSKGIPGIEIIGMGKYGKMIKEKFVYISKQKKVKFPMKRYVLCIEGEIEGKIFKEEEYRYLELPLLIMLWSLSGHLPFASLEDCFAAGKISVDEKIKYLTLDRGGQEQLSEMLMLDDEIKLKVIAPRDYVLIVDHYHLPLEDIFSSLSKVIN